MGDDWRCMAPGEPGFQAGLFWLISELRWALTDPRGLLGLELDTEWRGEFWPDTTDDLGVPLEMRGWREGKKLRRLYTACLLNGIEQHRATRLRRKDL